MITTVDNPSGLHGSPGSVPISRSSRQIRDKEPLWSPDVLCLCPGSISGNYSGILYLPFKLPSVNDSGSEGINPTFFPVTLYVIVETSQGLFFPIWDLNPGWHRGAEARWRVWGGENQNEREGSPFSMEALLALTSSHSCRGARSPAGAEELWLAHSFSLHFLSLMQVKILCFTSKIITSHTQKEKSERTLWFLQEIMQFSFRLLV